MYCVVTSCGPLSAWDTLSVLPGPGGVITVGEGVGVPLLTTAAVGVPVPGISVNTMMCILWVVCLVHRQKCYIIQHTKQYS